VSLAAVAWRVVRDGGVVHADRAGFRSGHRWPI